MLRTAVERAGDAGLASLDRLSSRRGFLKRSLVATGAVLGVGIGKEAQAAATFYCVASDGCGVRTSPWGTYVLTYSYGSSTTYEGGAYANPAYTGCIGVVNGDQEYFWRKRLGYSRYVHANLLALSFYAAC